MATAQQSLSNLDQTAALEEHALRLPPSQIEIAALAYAIWEAKGYPHGSDLDDWFLAEQTLTEKVTLPAD